MIRQRYTICKAVADDLQLEGWHLVGTFYDNDYKTDIFHLEREEEGNEAITPEKGQ